MSKGRRVPPRQEVISDLSAGIFTPERTKAEILRALAWLRQSKRAAQNATASLPLNRDTLAVYNKVFTRTYEQLCGVDSGGFDPLEPLEYTYLFKAGGAYKIGVTQDIPQRIRALQTGNPHPIVLVCFMITIVGAVEKELHKHFNPDRMQGEWFALSSEDVARIKEWFVSGVPTHFAVPVWDSTP